VPRHLDHRARFSQAGEHVLVKALVAKLAVERFDEGVLHLARCSATRPFWLTAQHRTTGEFRPIIANPVTGSARSILSRSSSRTTRTRLLRCRPPPARHSRLKSSTMHSMWKRRPSLRVPETKSSDQNWLILSGGVIGAAEFF